MEQDKDVILSRKIELIINQLSNKVTLLTTELAIANADNQVLREELNIYKSQLKEDSQDESSTSE